MSPDYVWHREDVLDLYAEPDDPRYPQVCFDESPVQLTSEKPVIRCRPVAVAWSIIKGTCFEIQDLRKNHPERWIAELLDEVVIQQAVFEPIDRHGRFLYSKPTLKLALWYLKGHPSIMLSISYQYRARIL